MINDREPTRTERVATMIGVALFGLVVGVLGVLLVRLAVWVWQ